MSLYFTDFEQYSLGETPSDWNKPWQTSAVFEVKATDFTDGKALYTPTNNSGNSFFEWQDIPDTTADIEIYGRIYMDGGSNAGVRASLGVRTSGETDATRSGYFIGILQSGGIRITKLVSGTSTTLANYGFTYTPNEWYNIRLRVVGNSIQVRVWMDWVPESSAFTSPVITDTSLTTGRAGVLYSNTSGGATYWDSIGVATETDAATFPAAPTTPIAPSLTYSNGYRFRKKLTIDYTKVGGSGITNFVMLADLTLPANKVTSSTGNDIRFEDASGNKLNHEIDEYNSTTGALLAWVRIGSISNTANTDIYVYYGKSGAAAEQSPTAVWPAADYAAVYHMKSTPDGNTGTFEQIDSTSNANHGTSVGSMNSADVVAAKIGSGIDFDGSNDYIDIRRVAGEMAGETSFGWTYWVKSLADATTSVTIAINTSSGGNVLLNYAAASSQKIAIAGNTTGSPAGDVASTDNVLDGNWHKVQLLRNGSTLQQYVDGVLQPAKTGVTMTLASTDLWQLGAEMDSGPTPGDYLDGILDEVQIQRFVPSAALILTEYNNQNSPGTFYATGAEEYVHAKYEFPSDSVTLSDAVTKSIGKRLIPITTPTEYYYHIDGHLVIDDSAAYGWSDIEQAFDDDVESTGGAMIVDSGGVVVATGSNAPIDDRYIYSVYMRVNVYYPSGINPLEVVVTHGEEYLAGLSVYTNGWSSWEEIYPPSGGWTMEAVNALTTEIRTDGSGTVYLRMIELEVVADEVVGGDTISTSDTAVADLPPRKKKVHTVYVDKHNSWNGSWINEGNIFDSDENTYGMFTVVSGNTNSSLWNGSVLRTSLPYFRMKDILSVEYEVVGSMPDGGNVLSRVYVSSTNEDLSGGLSAGWNAQSMPTYTTGQRYRLKEPAAGWDSLADLQRLQFMVGRSVANDLHVGMIKVYVTTLDPVYVNDSITTSDAVKLQFGNSKRYLGYFDAHIDTEYVKPDASASFDEESSLIPWLFDDSIYTGFYFFWEETFPSSSYVSGTGVWLPQVDDGSIQDVSVALWDSYITSAGADFPPFVDIYSGAELLGTIVGSGIDDPNGPALSDWVSLTTPSGGWSIETIEGLKAKVRLDPTAAFDFQEFYIHEIVINVTIGGIQLDDSVVITESSIRSIGKYQSDSVVVSEQKEKVHLGKGLTDIAGISDALAKSIHITKSDTITLLEEAGLFLGTRYELLIEDLISIGESISRQTGISLDDYVLADAIFVKAPGKVASDTANATDSAVKSSSKTRSDTVIASDVTSKKPGKAASDAVSTADAVSKRPRKVPSDLVSTADSVVKAFIKLVEDIVTPTDDTPLTMAIRRQDLVTLTDYATLAVRKAFADATTITDVSSKEIGKRLNDAVVAIESYHIAFAKYLSDNVTVTDQRMTVAQLFRAFADIVEAQEASTKRVGKASSDSVAVVDQLAKRYGKHASDIVNATDLVIKSVAMSVFDELQANDNIYKAIAKGVADSVMIEDIIARNYTLLFEDFIVLEDVFKRRLIRRIEQEILARASREWSALESTLRGRNNDRGGSDENDTIKARSRR